MKFSIFVPSYRRPQLLQRNLEALESQTRAADEILVALRPPEDPEGHAVATAFRDAHPEMPIRIVEVTTPGILPAENALLDAATGDVACFLDDDAIARRTWLENLARHYEDDGAVGGVAGPAIDVVDGAPRERRARFRNRVVFPGLVLDQSTRHTQRVVEVDHFRGANMSLRIAPLRAQGGFERRLRGDAFRFELDACLGVARQGWRLLFDPEVEADHHEAPRAGWDGREDPQTTANNAANESFVFLKHYGRGVRGWLHMGYAILVGNFPCPGLAWAIIGCIPRAVHRKRHIRGPSALLPALRGRIEAWRMAREALA